MPDKRIARKGDPAFCESDTHMTLLGPVTVPVIGALEQGSDNVFVNSKPMVRYGDGGTHVVCIGTNSFVVSGRCSSTYFCNSRPIALSGSETTHCGTDVPGAGKGRIIDACSPNTFGSVT